MLQTIARGAAGIALMTALQGCQALEDLIGSKDARTTANTVDDQGAYDTSSTAEGRSSQPMELPPECPPGRDQSPIDFTSVTSRAFPNIRFEYESADFETKNTGRLFELSARRAGGFDWNGEMYELEIVQFHTPSEHTFQGEHLDAEMQFVHKNSNGDFAVISVPLSAGEHNTSFDGLWSTLPAAMGASVDSTEEVNPESFFPRNRDFYWYEGTLTSTPCYDGVQWFVFQNPSSMSQAQIDALRNVFAKNNRPVQPTGDRTVWFGTAQ